MYTTKQFEDALLAQKVEISKLSYKDGFVDMAQGKIDGKMHQWNESGVCETYKGSRKHEYDLKFE